MRSRVEQAKKSYNLGAKTCTITDQRQTHGSQMKIHLTPTATITPALSGHSKKKHQNWFSRQITLNAGQKY